jgi:hypothetical protein
LSLCSQHSSTTSQPAGYPAPPFCVNHHHPIPLSLHLPISLSLNLSITKISDCCTDPECDKSHTYSAISRSLRRSIVPSCYRAIVPSPHPFISLSLHHSISQSHPLSITPSHPSPQSVSICANLWTNKSCRKTANPCQSVQSVANPTAVARQLICVNL